MKPAVTDADGRFMLRGVGSGRIAELLLEGPGIESAKIFARTETGKKIELLRERRSPDLGSYTYYPAELTYVAGPSVVITGVRPRRGNPKTTDRRYGEESICATANQSAVGDRISSAR